MPEPTAPSVELTADPPTVMGLLLTRLLGRAVRREPAAAARMAGRQFRLRADAQTVLISGREGGLIIGADDGRRVVAEIHGDLAALLGAARGRLWSELATRRLRVRGRIWRLLPLLRLFRSLDGKPPEEASAGD